MELPKKKASDKQLAVLKTLFTFMNIKQDSLQPYLRKARLDEGVYPMGNLTVYEANRLISILLRD